MLDTGKGELIAQIGKHLMKLLTIQKRLLQSENNDTETIEQCLDALHSAASDWYGNVRKYEILWQKCYPKCRLSIQELREEEY